MEIRKATIEDIAVLVNLRMAMRQERDKLEEDVFIQLRKNTQDYFIRNILDNSYLSFLAVERDEIVGTVGIIFFEMPPTEKLQIGKVAKLMNMYTIKKYRKKGIGTELLKYTIAFLKDMGYRKIMLNSSSMGRAIYEKMGFKDISNELELMI